MKGKERFLTALNNGIPDRVPTFDFIYSRYVFQKVLGQWPSRYDSEQAIRCALELGLDGAVIFPERKLHFISEDVYVDEWRTKFRRTNSSWPFDFPIEYPICEMIDLENYDPPKPVECFDAEKIGRCLEIAGDSLAVLGNIPGPFTTAWMLTGYENIAVKLFDNPVFLESLLRIGCDFYIRLAELMINCGIHVIIIAEDLGHDTGLFISPEHLKSHVFPYLEKLIRFIKNKETPVLLHCDGNINLILQDLVNMGISGYHPIERKAQMHLKEVKTKYGYEICLVGNVSSSSTLPYGSSEEIEREVIDCINVAAPGGGYILASDHSLHEGIPIQNVLHMIEAAKRHGKYNK